jgi:hypothetical protein
LAAAQVMVNEFASIALRLLATRGAHLMGMRRLALAILAFAALSAAPAHAQRVVTVTVEEWTEVDGAERLVDAHAAAAPQGIAAYGPFRVIDPGHAALVDATDGASPRAFAAMLRDHPGIATLEMVECPGTDDDTANLALGRMIRARGIATHVPADGSVRSGAVELFLAGVTRAIDDGAEFAVHAWRDSDGKGPADYSADAAPNRAYLDYYREMGLARPKAFYDMTNAVPNSGARWLTAAEMRPWVGEAGGRDPAIAYLDLGHGFP